MGIKEGFLTKKKLSLKTFVILLVLFCFEIYYVKPHGNITSWVGFEVSACGNSQLQSNLPFRLTQHVKMLEFLEVGDKMKQYAPEGTPH